MTVSWPGSPTPFALTILRHKASSGYRVDENPRLIPLVALEEGEVAVLHELLTFGKIVERNPEGGHRDGQVGFAEEDEGAGLGGGWGRGHRGGIDFETVRSLSDPLMDSPLRSAHRRTAHGRGCLEGCVAWKWPHTQGVKVGF